MQSKRYMHYSRSRWVWIIENTQSILNNIQVSAFATTGSSCELEFVMHIVDNLTWENGTSLFKIWWRTRIG